MQVVRGWLSGIRVLAEASSAIGWVYGLRKVRRKRVTRLRLAELGFSVLDWFGLVSFFGQRRLGLVVRAGSVLGPVDLVRDVARGVWFLGMGLGSGV